MSKQLTKPDLEKLVEDSDGIGRAQKAAPTWGDIQHAFPDAKIVDHPDGTRTCRIEDHSPEKRRLRLLSEMFRPTRRIEAEVGQKKQHRHREVVMRDPSGKTRYVREEHQEAVERKLGSRRVGGRSPSYIVWFDRDGTKWIRRRGEEWTRG